MILLLIFTNILYAQDCWTVISAGSGHTLAIKKDGTLWGWGKNYSGQLGNGKLTAEEIRRIYELRNAQKYKSKEYKDLNERFSHTNIKSDVPLQIGKDRDWMKVYAGGDQSFAIKEDGSLWGWGDNYYGQLGDGTINNVNVPLQIGSEKWIDVASGARHTIAVKEDGTLWAWGNNSFGQLGDGSTTSSLKPIQISSEKWRNIAANNWYSAAISEEGFLLTWGGTHRRPLMYASSLSKLIAVNLLYGLLNSSDHKKSTSMTSLKTDWVRMHAGDYHLLAIDSAGKLWGTGDSDFGQLGPNITENTDEMELMDDTRKWIDIGSNRFSSYALDSENKLWGWGKNTELYNENHKLYTNEISPVISDKKWNKITYRLGEDAEGNYFSFQDQLYKSIPLCPSEADHN